MSDSPRSELPSLISPLPFVADLPSDWHEWLRRAGVVPGTPFLLSPSYEYDVVLNDFFRNVKKVARRRRPVPRTTPHQPRSPGSPASGRAT